MKPIETKVDTFKDDANAVHRDGIYLYAIIRHPGPIEFGRIGMGSKGELVYGINYKDVCAVVSRSSRIRYDARRLHLMTHELVLEEVMKDHSILPIRFSTISESFDELKIVAILRREYDKISGLLDKMEGKRELGLKVVGLEGPIFKYILEKHDNIRKAREEVSKLPPDRAHFQYASVGEMVEKALQEENEKFRKIILDSITPWAEEIKINSPYGERMILNGAFLIKETKQPMFDEAIKALDAKYGSLLSFKYVGPLPPYNFVNLVINI